MAAHVLTVINQIIEREKEMPAHTLINGMSYAKWGDNLHHEDWRKLYNRLQAGKSSKEWAKDVWEKYRREWVALGKPETAEEWQTAKYS